MISPEAFGLISSGILMTVAIVGLIVSLYITPRFLRSLSSDSKSKVKEE